MLSVIRNLNIMSVWYAINTGGGFQELPVAAFVQKTRLKVILGCLRLDCFYDARS